MLTPTLNVFVCSNPKNTSQCGSLSKNTFSCFCVSMETAVRRSAGFLCGSLGVDVSYHRSQACRVVALKKASVSICPFLHLMVAGERGWKSNTTDETISIKGWRISHERSAIYITLEGSKTRAFTRLKIHSANETSAILSLVRPIHVNGCTCASDPPWAGTL